MAGPWEAYQTDGPKRGPWDAYAKNPDQVPIGTTGGGPEIGQGEALLEGYKSGVSANFSDEVKGLSEASGLPRALGGFRAPVGAAKVIWEYLSKNPGEASSIYERATGEARERSKAAEEQHPGTYAVGNVGGAVATAPLLPVARAATLGGRAWQGAKVGGAYGAAAGVGAGETNEERVVGGVSGGVVGGVVGGFAAPVVEGIIQGGRALAAPVINAVRGIRDPAGEAARRTATALERDVAADPGAVSRLTPREFADNVQGGGPATIMDIGGETTRALARSAANTSPEARSGLNNALNDRFEGQGPRVTDWMRQTFHFPNALAQQEAIETTARTVNRANYGRALREGDTQIWSPELERLTSGPAVVSALQGAATRGKDRAVSEGFGGFNPGVTVDNGGIVTFRRGPNGQPTYPNLQFWDYAKRELDDSAQAARRAGRNEEAGALTGLATQLRGELDRLVPSYAQARAGAASFFGAENALEAGQNYVMQNFASPATRQALARMSPVERQLFQDGFVSRFVETLDRVGDRRSILNQVAANPAAREKLEIALGRQRAGELEANLRIEGIMDLARTAVQGNSTTARQLVELGLAGGVGGYGYLSSDPSAIMNAAFVWGAARGHRAIDARVAAQVSRMLTSQDPRMLLLGVQMVARNNNFMHALRTTDQALARIGAAQTPAPALQIPGIGRADEQQSSAYDQFKGNVVSAMQDQSEKASRFAESTPGKIMDTVTTAMSLIPAGRGLRPMGSRPMMAAEMGGSPKGNMGVPEYVSELKKLATDNAGFDQLVSQLKADRSITQQQMREISQQFIGWEFAPSKPRTEALQKIVERQMVDARQTARGANIDKTNKSW